MTLRTVLAAGTVIGLSLLALPASATSTAEGPTESVESVASATLVVTVRTWLPAGAIFVARRDDSTERFLAARSFTGHAPGVPLDVSMQAPPGEGTYRVYLNGYAALSPPGRVIASGLLAVRLAPGATTNVQALQRDGSPSRRATLDLCIDGCEDWSAPAAPETEEAASVRSPTVPLEVSLSTKMTAGAFFVEWSGAGAAREVAGRAFLDHDPATPIELGLVVPPGPGTLRVHGGDARMTQGFVSAPVSLAPAPLDRPRIRVTEVQTEEPGRHSAFVVEILPEPSR